MKTRADTQNSSWHPKTPKWKGSNPGASDGDNAHSQDKREELKPADYLDMFNNRGAGYTPEQIKQAEDGFPKWVSNWSWFKKDKRDENAWDSDTQNKAKKPHPNIPGNSNDHEPKQSAQHITPPTPEECNRLKQMQDNASARVKIGIPAGCWTRTWIGKRDEGASESGPKDESTDASASDNTSETPESSAEGDDHGDATGDDATTSGDDSASVYSSEASSMSMSSSSSGLSILPTTTSSQASRPATTDGATRKAVDAVCALVKSLAGVKQGSGEVNGLVSLCDKLQGGSSGATSTGSAAAHITSSAAIGTSSTSTSAGSDSSSSSGSSSASGGSSDSSSTSSSPSSSTADGAKPTDQE